MYDVIIKNGTVVDGSISKSRKEDVAIVGDEIVEIGELKNAAAKFYIDATGKVVSPGFIDTHTRSTFLLNHLYLLKEFINQLLSKTNILFHGKRP